jgi:uncharacterized protein (DUF433 family)
MAIIDRGPSVVRRSELWYDSVSTSPHFPPPPRVFAMVTAQIDHIVLNDHGVPLISGTTTKVVEVIMDYQTWGWTPDMIHKQYPYLSLAQIHAAFAYYYDHQKELDADIERREREHEQLLAAQPETPGRKKLRDLGLLP